MPAQQSIIDLINDAGWWIVGLRSWNWLKRESVPFDVTALQEYVELPDNVLEAIDIVPFEGNVVIVQWGSPQQVEYARAFGSPESVPYFGYVSFPDTALTEGQKNPRIELGPVPQTSTTNAGKL